MTVFPAAVASMNMYLRLRETKPNDPNYAGTLVSQVRFQGASHGGISSCMSVPTDTVSAATALVGCALAVTATDRGNTLANIVGIIKTGQSYNVELVMRADLTAPFITDPYNAYIPEGVNYTDGAKGLSWFKKGTIRIGTDPEVGLAEVRDDITELQGALTELRQEFEGHTHTYQTGRGKGHNKKTAETPGPILNN